MVFDIYLNQVNDISIEFILCIFVQVVDFLVVKEVGIKIGINYYYIIIGVWVVVVNCQLGWEKV